MKKPTKESYTVDAELYVDLESALNPGAPSRSRGSIPIDVERAVAFNAFLTGINGTSGRIRPARLISKRPPTSVHKNKMTRLIQDAALSDRWPSIDEIGFGDEHKPTWYLDETRKAGTIVEASGNMVVGVVDSNIAELGSCVLSCALQSPEPLQPIILGAVEHTRTAQMFQQLEYFVGKFAPDIEMDIDLDESGIEKLSMSRLTAASFTIEVVRLGDFSYDSGVAFSESVDDYCF